MEDTKVSKSDWQLLIGVGCISEHQAMARAIHWFQTESRCCVFRMVMVLYYEKVLLVVFVMTRYLPEIQMVHVGSDHFLVAPLVVLTSHQINELVIDLSAM